MFFNVVALAGFGAMLYIDMNKRMEWAEAVLMRQIAINGLPVDDKDQEGREVALQLRHELDPPLIKEQYDKRGINTKGDKFLPVSENFRDQIRFQDLDQPVINRYFSAAGVTEPVMTLKAEIDRVKKSLPASVDIVAKVVVERASSS